MKDDAWLRQVPLTDQPQPTHPAAATARAVERLDTDAALHLLSKAPYGRVVFVHDGALEIRPLSHIVEGGQVIVRMRPGAALSEALASEGGGRITYEADELDVEARLGWSVIVSGTATAVTDPEQTAYYKQILKTMLAAGDDTVIAIRPTTVTGIRIVPGETGISEKR